MLNRRSFIRKSGVFTALSLGSYTGLKAGTGIEKPVRKTRILPKGLKRGDLIGLVTPGGPIEEKQLEETIQKLENLGFRTYYQDSVLSAYGYFAGLDQERADELMNLFTNQEVDGIWCVRGGYGSI